MHESEELIPLKETDLKKFISAGRWVEETITMEK